MRQDEGKADEVLARSHRPLKRLIVVVVVCGLRLKLIELMDLLCGWIVWIVWKDFSDRGCDGLNASIATICIVCARAEIAMLIAIARIEVGSWLLLAEGIVLLR